jgi:hypothetical protein
MERAAFFGAAKEFSRERIEHKGLTGSYLPTDFHDSSRKSIKRTDYEIDPDKKMA